MDAVNDGSLWNGAAVAGGAQAPLTTAGAGSVSAAGAQGEEDAGAGMGAAGATAVANAHAADGDDDAAAALASRFSALNQLDTMDDAARDALFSSIHAELQRDLDGIV